MLQLRSQRAVDDEGKELRASNKIEKEFILPYLAVSWNQ